MEPKPRQVHRRWTSCVVQGYQDLTQLAHVLGVDPACLTRRKQSLQTPVAKPRDHYDTYNVSGYTTEARYSGSSPCWWHPPICGGAAPPPRWEKRRAARGRGPGKGPRSFNGPATTRP